MNLLNECYDCFQVSLGFDPVKEVLKIQCQIYILMKKVIILRKMQQGYSKTLWMGVSNLQTLPISGQI